MGERSMIVDKEQEIKRLVEIVWSPTKEQLLKKGKLLEVVYDITDRIERWSQYRLPESYTSLDFAEEVLEKVEKLKEKKKNITIEDIVRTAIDILAGE